jgi:glycosyltransferase involved in cell wall biosynthesis
MKIAVLSDTRLPTSADFPGHGLGKQVLAAANGLASKGHDVTLFAGAGSTFEHGALVIEADEKAFIPFLPTFDAVLDSTHQHLAQQKWPQLAIVNWSHDREGRPGRNAVFPSDAHRNWHGYKPDNARVIYNAIELPPLPDATPDGYYAYLSMMHAPKGPLMAREAARLAGVKLVMAGPTPPAILPDVEYIGPIFGDDKLEFLARATALLFCSGIEAGPITPLEAQAVNCPVIGLDYGATKENILPNKTGLIVNDTLGMVEAIGKVAALRRQDCREWLEECRPLNAMVNQLEAALVDVVNGKGW